MTSEPGAPRTITVLTSGRQDWGIVRSTCAALASSRDLTLELLVGGMHLSPRHGRTVDLVLADGFTPVGATGSLRILRR